MTIAAGHETGMSVAEYQRWAEGKPDWERWELLDGQPVLMPLSCERHQTITANIVFRLGDLTDGKGCRALPGLAILSEVMDDFAPIPDVVVRCGPPLPDGYAPDPVLVAEVLSPSTMTIDRGRKVDFYKSVASLRHFLIVYPDEVRIEMFSRVGAQAWQSVVLGLDDGIDLPELDGAVAVRDVYRDIAF